MRKFALAVLAALLALLIGSTAYAAPPTKKPKPTPTPTPTPTQTVTPTPTTASPTPSGDCAPTTITAGGTYSGHYCSTDPAVPAVKISTTDAVTLDHARVEHTGKGVEDTLQGTNVTSLDTIYQQLPLSQVVNHRAIELEGVAAFTAEHNQFIDGDGVWIGGAAGQVGSVSVRYNEAVNVGRYPHPTSSNCCVQFVQFDHVVSSQIVVAWNKITNTPGQSDAEDVINFYFSGGTDSANRSDVHHNLVDGAYSRGLNDPVFTGGGINIADAGAAHNLAHDNTVVSVTNYGVSAHQLDNYADDNLLVNDGAEQVSDQGQAVVAFQSVSPAGAHARRNRYNWHRFVGDTSQWPCYQAVYCTPDTEADKNTQVSLTEDQARAEWEAARVAAGVSIGPR